VSELESVGFGFFVCFHVTMASLFDLRVRLCAFSVGCYGFGSESHWDRFSSHAIYDMEGVMASPFPSPNSVLVLGDRSAIAQCHVVQSTSELFGCTSTIDCVD